MKVRVAESAGFCMGVRKAMDSVLEASRGNVLTYTLGPLIHNPQALKMLESRNVYIAGDIDESLAGETVVIRAHGITLDKRERLSEIGAKVVDATCPKVLRSENIIKKYYAGGYSIIIVGDRGHAEIDALLSYTGNTGIVVENMKEAENLPRMEKVCVVAQTTFNSFLYNEITDVICKNAGECYVADTVCVSTDRRQADVRKLAEVTDATVVVGGKNSANTRRLAEISRELKQPTYLIEDPAELDLEELSQYNEIGVTAGASTPNWVIKQVMDSIAGYTPKAPRSLYTLFMTIAFFAIEGNLVICAAAAALTYAMCTLMKIPPSWPVILMPLFYLFPLHSVNKYFEINWKLVSVTEHAPRLRRYWIIYLAAGFVSFFISLGIAWYSSTLTFILVAVSYLLGGLYSVRIIPGAWNFRFKSLRDIPGSKDIVTAAAWTFAVVALPAISNSVYPGPVEIMGGAFAFIFVLSRTSLLAIGGIQSDKLIGLETFPVLFGRKKTVKILYTANISLALAIVFLALSNIIWINTLILIAPVLYMLACIKYLGRKGQFFTLYHQMTLDAVFFLTGLLAFLVSG